jgi:hypothetical protein
MGCPQNTHEAPSREFQPYVYDTLDSKGTVVAEIDADRRSILIVSTVATGGQTINVVGASSGAKAGPKVWPLAPGEGVALNTAAKVIVVPTNNAAASSCKVMIERGTA